MRFWRRQKPVPTAREQRDEWLTWLEFGGAATKTVDGYRRTTIVDTLRGIKYDAERSAAPEKAEAYCFDCGEQVDVP